MNGECFDVDFVIYAPKVQKEDVYAGLMNNRSILGTTELFWAPIVSKQDKGSAGIFVLICHFTA